MLETIDWSTTTFDVIVVETDPPSRPPNFTEAVSEYLKARGYELVFLTTGLRCEGRNNWYKHVNFKPSSRPGLNHQCYRGLERSHYCNMTACESSWRTYDTTDLAEVALAQQKQQQPHRSRGRLRYHRQFRV